MENRRRQMQQFLTPQHPSMGKSHWGEPQDFRTPQHPSLVTNHWGAESQRFGTPEHESLGSNGWVGEPRQFRTPQRPSLATNYCGTATGTRQWGTPPQHPSSITNYWGTAGGTRQFGTPQHPGSFREFRTPQHPSMGTNNWGGASPLLARNIPQESLDQRYDRLYTVRTGDEILTPPILDDEDEDFFYVSNIEATKYEIPPTPSRRGLLWKFIKGKPKTKNVTTLGNSSKKKRWFPKMKLDVKKKWPNGWI